MESINKLEEIMFEIGYYVGRSNVLAMNYACADKYNPINYQALNYAHVYWREYRELDKIGEPL